MTRFELRLNENAGNLIQIIFSDSRERLTEIFGSMKITALLVCVDTRFLTPAHAAGVKILHEGKIHLIAVYPNEVTFI
jgi:hypothetical protein